MLMKEHLQIVRFVLGANAVSPPPARRSGSRPIMTDEERELADLAARLGRDIAHDETGYYLTRRYPGSDDEWVASDRAGTLGRLRKWVKRR